MLIADVPAEFIANQNSFTHASAHISQHDDTSASSSYLYAQAYWKYWADKLHPQPKSQSWTETSAPKVFAPDPPGNKYNIETMTGKITVILLVVSGPTMDLSISEEDLCNVISEVTTGLEFWQRNAPASAVYHLRFSMAMQKSMLKIALPDPVLRKQLATMYLLMLHFNISVTPLVKLAGMN